MHIPDGFLSPPVWATLDAVSLPAIAVVARRARDEQDERSLPLLGVLGAFVFAAQMINFPVAVGTSAHLLGGALLACAVGPFAAVVAMTAVLLIQAFVFQDGGILALGANVLNLAFIGVLAGYLPYRWLGQGRFRDAGIFLGGALSVLLSGCAALAELAISGVHMQQTIAMVSLGFFLVNAVVEGAITVAVVRALRRMDPGWVRRPEQPPAGGSLVWVGVAAILLAGLGFLVASRAPDSLETIAASVGLAGQEISVLPAPIADYQLAGVKAEWVAKAAAGLVGVALVYLLSMAVGKLIVRRST